MLIVLVIAQFFGPELNEGDITSVSAFLNDTNPPDEVKLILKESCFDCHSEHTRYPWYNKITPVNYWLAEHVRDGKKHFNVSVWNDYSNKKKDHKLEELIEEVKTKEMPLPSYTWTHGDADLSQEQITAMVDWAEQVRLKYVFEKEAE
ncbi:MAG: heme-binding domain-containing protein [Winogradskyella sp.]|nr:heme-binding domain-containing protein [Winogradskyella sp.]